MASHKQIRIPYRRKAEQRTNYKTRLNLLKSRTPRLVVRITNKNIIAQIVSYSPQGDNVILTVTSAELKKLGWNYSTNNTPAAYLTGYLVAKKSLDKKVKNVILDIGFHTSVKGAKIYAVLKGAKDGKLDIPADESICPSMERIKGEHIKKYAQINNKQFTGYAKKNADAQSIDKSFEELKNKILK